MSALLTNRISHFLFRLAIVNYCLNLWLFVNPWNFHKMTRFLILRMIWSCVHDVVIDQEPGKGRKYDEKGALRNSVIFVHWSMTSESKTALLVLYYSLTIVLILIEKFSRSKYKLTKCSALIQLGIQCNWTVTMYVFLLIKYRRINVSKGVGNRFSFRMPLSILFSTTKWHRSVMCSFFCWNKSNRMFVVLVVGLWPFWGFMPPVWSLKFSCNLDGWQWLDYPNIFSSEHSSYISQRNLKMGWNEY